MNVHALRSVVHDAASRRRLAEALRVDLSAMLRDMPLRQRRTLILLGTWSLLMLLLACMFCLSSTAPDLEGALPAPVAHRSGSETAADMARAIDSRPLFEPSRRAPFVAAPVAQPTVSLRDHAIRVGGVLRDGSDAKAFLVSTDHPLGAWLAVGDRIGGWTIAAIAPSQVDLRADGETFVATMPGAETTASR